MKYKVKISLLLIVVWTYALGGGKIQLYQERKIEELKLPFFKTWIVDVRAYDQKIYESYGISCSRVGTSEFRIGFTEKFFRLYESGEIAVALDSHGVVILSDRNKQIKITAPHLHSSFEKYFKELKNQEKFAKTYTDTLSNVNKSLVNLLTALTRRTNMEWKQEFQFKLKYDGVKETFVLPNRQLALVIKIIYNDRNVKIFNMSGCHSTTCFNALLEVLRKLLDIEVLILANCDLDTNAVDSLFKVLTRNINIQVIDLFGNNLAEDIVSKFEDIVTRNRFIRANSSTDYGRLFNATSCCFNVMLALVQNFDTHNSTLLAVLQHNPAVDAIILTVMLVHPNVDAELLENIAKHPEANADVLLGVVQHDIVDAGALEVVARHPKVDDSVLIEVVLHSCMTSDLLNEILVLPNISDDVLVAIVERLNPWDVMNQPGITAGILAKIAANSNIGTVTLLTIAQNPITDLNGLNAIVYNPNIDAQILAMVATHPNVDSSLLATILTLYSGIDTSVLLTIARNPLASPVVLSKIIGRPNITPAILAAVAANENADANNLLEIASSPVTDISGLLAVVSHTQVTTACLSAVASHPNAEIVLRNIAVHPKADANTLLNVVQNPAVDQMSLIMVSNNPNADDRVKNAITADFSTLTPQRTTAPLTFSVNNVTIDNMFSNTANSAVMSNPSSAGQIAGLLVGIPQTSEPQMSWLTAAISFFGLFNKKIEKPALTSEDLAIKAVARLVNSDKLPEVSQSQTCEELLRDMNIQPEAVNIRDLLAMAQNPRADISTLLAIVNHPQVDALTLANVAAHANADLQVLFAVAMHPATSILGLTVVIRNPRANGFVHLAVENHSNADYILYVEIMYYGIVGTIEQVSPEKIKYYSSERAVRWRNEN